MVVECQAGGDMKWVDATLRHRLMPDYGMGLPVAADAPWVDQPQGTARDNVYELSESILIDTTGSWSLLAVVTRTRGRPADALRQELAALGMEAFAKKRLRDCADRFTHARRARPLQYRDDSLANEFFLTEVFEIKDFLSFDPKTKWYKLTLVNNFDAAGLALPRPGPRRAPFALPHPCRVVHTIELHSVALPPAELQQRAIETDYLYFIRWRKTLAGCWTMILALSTRAGVVEPKFLGEHREALRKIQTQSAWVLMLPPGDPCPHQRDDFGALPKVWEPLLPIPAAPHSRPLPGPDPVQPQTAPLPAPPLPGALPPNGAGEKDALIPPVPLVPPIAPAPLPELPRPRFKRQKRNRRKREPEPVTRWHIAAACGLGLILILIVILVTRNAEHWSIFQWHTPLPKTPGTPSSTP